MMASLSGARTPQAARTPAPRLAAHRGRVALVRASTASEAGALTQPSRRALGALLGGALLLSQAKPSSAAYGEAAKVFGAAPTNATGFIPYKGTGFELLLPSRWEPTRERVSPDVQLSYVDTYPANSLVVLAKQTNKNSIKDYGSPDAFLQDISFLFGDNVWKGATRSEGGFKTNAVSSASILEADFVTGKDGKPHVTAHVLTRSADGNEGGKHQLISAAISNGQLFVMKAQIGDKRWATGGSRESKTLQESFAVA